MGLKKYEIITVGSDKRVRALRSWQVQDRYVNIGDVGGIVYDEKTLSQDGACWLFRGNFNFPGARIGGDSIVDVGEAAPDATGSANLDILGTSTVVGAPVKFTVGLGAVNGLVFPTSYFEQGDIAYSKGSNWETWKVPSTQRLRLKSPIFMGGVSATLKLGVPGYSVQAFVMDRDGIGTAATAVTDTGGGVTLTVPAGQYFLIKLSKNPNGPIVPVDATAAQISTTVVFEAKLVVVDSRLELNPANGTGAVAIRSGGVHSVSVGSKYPDSVIQDSKVVINSHATTARMTRMLTELVNVNATIDATEADAQAVGIYHGVNNLTFSGLLTSNWDEAARSLIQAYNCDNMVVNTTNFPGLAAMQTAGVPIKFYNCNLIEGRFYHHAQIANTYKNIDFAKAQTDLGKQVGSVPGRILVSSEIEGLYRIFAGTTSYGALVESYGSVKSLTIPDVTGAVSATYGTTIYADAYFNGLFGIQGTNVFGNTMKHDASNTQNVQAVQGGLTLTANQPPAPNNSPNVVSTINPIRINGGNGFTVTLPTGIQARLIFIDARGIYVTASGWLSNVVTVPAANLTAYAAFVTFQISGGTAITPDDIKGVTVTTYNGCRIVNTKATGAMIAGNVRVEDNATLIDTSVTGTGYFGGNSTIQAPSDLAGQLPIAGAAYMSDNAVFAPSAANASAGISLLEMKDNATFAGRLGGAVKYNITMSNDARFFGSHNSGNAWVLKGNSYVAPAAVINALCEGVSIMEDDARIENESITTVGYITLRGKYKQTASKTWTGKRVIDSQDAPQYDDNVKTKYDI